jgi:hypothetical protein
MDGRMSNDQLAKGLQELAQLADSPMPADGNHLLGASGNDFFRFFSGNGNDHLVLLKR